MTVNRRQAAVASAIEAYRSVLRSRRGLSAGSRKQVANYGADAQGGIGASFCCLDRFRSPSPGDSIDLRYLNEKGQWDGSACKRLSHFFRCRQTGQEVRIDPRLFLFLDALRNGLSADEQPFLLFSGYRSPAYNRLLARRDGHVARNSFHTKGMAADVALAGVPLADLEHLARRLGVGGVDRYGEFVHLDIGPVRHW